MEIRLDCFPFPNRRGFEPLDGNYTNTNDFSGVFESLRVTGRMWPGFGCKGCWDFRLWLYRAGMSSTTLVRLAYLVLACLVLSPAHGLELPSLSFVWLDIAGLLDCSALTTLVRLCCPDCGYDCVLFYGNLFWLLCFIGLRSCFCFIGTFSAFCFIGLYLAASSSPTHWSDWLGLDWVFYRAPFWLRRQYLYSVCFIGLHAGWRVLSSYWIVL